MATNTETISSGRDFIITRSFTEVPDTINNNGKTYKKYDEAKLTLTESGAKQVAQSREFGVFLANLDKPNPADKWKSVITVVAIGLRVRDFLTQPPAVPFQVLNELSRETVTLFYDRNYVPGVFATAPYPIVRTTYEAVGDKMCEAIGLGLKNQVRSSMELSELFTITLGLTSFRLPASIAADGAMHRAGLYY